MEAKRLELNDVAVRDLQGWHVRWALDRLTRPHEGQRVLRLPLAVVERLSGGENAGP